MVTRTTTKILLLVATIPLCQIALQLNNQNLPTTEKYNNINDFWDLSTWRESDVNDLRQTIVTMHEIRDDLKITQYIESLSTEKNLEMEIGTDELEDKVMRGRRLRQSSSTTKNSEAKWEEEVHSMQGEFMTFFLKQQGTQGQNQGNGQYKEKMKINGKIKSKIKPQHYRSIQVNKRQMLDGQYKEKRIMKGRIKSKHYNSTQANMRQIQKVTSQLLTQTKRETRVKCPDPFSNILGCPPEELPQLCDKYNKGNFLSCYQLCKESFCCIHDSFSNKASSCAPNDNCELWSPCYIIWWRLQNTIGPLNRLNVEQTDDFFNVDYEYLEEDQKNDPTFWDQLIYHHWNDDGVINSINDEWLDNPENW